MLTPPPPASRAEPSHSARPHDQPRAPAAVMHSARAVDRIDPIQTPSRTVGPSPSADFALPAAAATSPGAGAGISPSPFEDAAAVADSVLDRVNTSDQSKVSPDELDDILGVLDPQRPNIAVLPSVVVDADWDANTLHLVRVQKRRSVSGLLPVRHSDSWVLVEVHLDGQTLVYVPAGYGSDYAVLGSKAQDQFALLAQQPLADESVHVVSLANEGTDVSNGTDSAIAVLVLALCCMYGVHKPPQISATVARTIFAPMFSVAPQDHETLAVSPAHGEPLPFPFEGKETESLEAIRATGAKSKTRLQHISTQLQELEAYRAITNAIQDIFEDMPQLTQPEIEDVQMMEAAFVRSQRAFALSVADQSRIGRALRSPAVRERVRRCFLNSERSNEEMIQALEMQERKLRAHHNAVVNEIQRRRDEWRRLADDMTAEIR